MAIIRYRSLDDPEIQNIVHQDPSIVAQVKATELSKTEIVENLDKLFEKRS
jgi:hypothetical protein